MVQAIESSPAERRPVVSVIIPFRNAGHFVEQTSSALEGLDASRFEIIAIDDHSVDETATALAAWVQKVSHARLLQADGTGVASARNQAVRAARGEFIWFIDCDDSWDLQILGQMLETAIQTGADTVIVNAESVVEGAPFASLIEDAPVVEHINGEEAVRRLLRGDVQGHLWNKLFRTSVVGASPFPTTYAHSDLGGMFGLLARSEKVELRPWVLYRYVLRSGSITNASTYCWSDLPTCLRIAQRTVATKGACQETRQDFALFLLRKVVIPIENETVRRERLLPSDLLKRIRRTNRRRVTVYGVMRLVRVRDYLAAAQALLILCLPMAYHAFYRRRRARVWRGLDNLTAA